MRLGSFAFVAVVAAIVVGASSVAHAAFTNCKRHVWGTWNGSAGVYQTLTDGGCPGLINCFPVDGDCETDEDTNTVPVTQWCACGGHEPPCNIRLQGYILFTAR
jgi:hypothetical protein